jgi:GNAT superfamily N-acetyltransferase
MKLPKVREATLKDEPLFRHLAMEYMKDQAAKGDLIIPNEHNVDAWVVLFRAFVTGEKEGFVLLVGDYAVMIHGDPLSPFQMYPGKCSMLWMTYVKPKHQGRGITHVFHQKTMQILTERKVEWTMTNFLEGNPSIPKVIDAAVDEVHGAAIARPYAHCWVWAYRTKEGEIIPGGWHTGLPYCADDAIRDYEESLKPKEENS